MEFAWIVRSISQGDTHGSVERQEPQCPEISSALRADTDEFQGWGNTSSDLREAPASTTARCHLELHGEWRGCGE